MVKGDGPDLEKDFQYSKNVSLRAPTTRRRPNDVVNYYIIIALCVCVCVCVCVYSTIGGTVPAEKHFYRCRDIFYW